MEGAAGKELLLIRSHSAAGAAGGAARQSVRPAGSLAVSLARLARARLLSARLGSARLCAGQGSAQRQMHGSLPGGQGAKGRESKNKKEEEKRKRKLKRVSELRGLDRQRKRMGGSARPGLWGLVQLTSLKTRLSTLRFLKRILISSCLNPPSERSRRRLFACQPDSGRGGGRK